MNITAQQRQTLLSSLLTKPLSTIDARRELDIMHPAARVMELREESHNIKTHWSDEPTECGRLHRMARYVLFLPGPDKATAPNPGK
jgi:hypothetical protein